jgi:hypothetical protein
MKVGGRLIHYPDKWIAQLLPRQLKLQSFLKATSNPIVRAKSRIQKPSLLFPWPTAGSQLP